MTVFTSANPYMVPLLTEWLISLRAFGNYRDKIIILDYGISKPIRDKLTAVFNNIKWVSCRMSNSIINTRFIDIIPILEENPDEIYAHFDADIWFQDDVNDIWEIADKQDGCLFASDVAWFILPYAATENSQKDFYKEKLTKIRSIYGGSIQGGFVCARGKYLLEKYKKFRQMLSDYWLTWEYMTDQFALNLTFDFDKDCADYKLWNGVGTDTIHQDGIWKLKKTGEKLKGVHVVGMLRHETNRRFRNIHQGIFNQYLTMLGCDINAKKITITGDGIIEKLKTLILLCKDNIGKSMILGDIEQPIFPVKDIGCTGLVKNGTHGHEHYWDIIGLPRQDHICGPDNLFINTNAVRKISQIDLNYPIKLCSKFPIQFYDFMLTIMLREHNINIEML